MTREDYSEEISKLSDSRRRLLLKLATGTGKTKIALDILHKDWLSSREKDPLNLSPVLDILIAIPKNVLEDSWKEQMDQWYPDWKEWLCPVFTTYISLYKHLGIKWDAIILDECHHFTERCLIAVQESDVLGNNPRVICLSGTVPRNAKDRLYDAFAGMWTYRISSREAIDNNILPDPSVFLIPMALDNSKVTEDYVKCRGRKGARLREVRVTYVDRFSALREENVEVHIKCTQFQYYLLLQQDIDFWKKQYTRMQHMWQYNRWQQLCNHRIKWLSSIKTPLVDDLQKKFLTKVRYITFCSSIEQAKVLDVNCIHSKDKDSYGLLDKFNDCEISHISAIDIINEGLNVSSCQVGLFADLKASEIVTRQRLGRILRHEKPLIIVPYYVNTRDEELVNKMKLDYNPKLTHTVYMDNLGKEFKEFFKKTKEKK